MISYLKRHEINDEKWNETLAHSNHSTPSAATYFLDVVCPQWDALVLDDYKAVMPLPYVKEEEIFCLIMPCFVKKLGVFSPEKVSQELVQSFIKAIPDHWKIIKYHFNPSNIVISAPEHCKLSTRINYELNLNISQDEFKNKIKDNVWNSYKTASNHLKIVNDLDVNDYMVFCLKNSKYNCSKIEFYLLNSLIEAYKKRKQGYIVGVVDESGQLCATNFFINDFKKILNLYPVSSEEEKKNAAIRFLIMKEIKKYIGKEMVFDFDGGMAESFAKFYSSFGADITNYNQIKNKKE